MVPFYLFVTPYFAYGILTIGALLVDKAQFLIYNIAYSYVFLARSVPDGVVPTRGDPVFVHVRVRAGQPRVVQGLVDSKATPGAQTRGDQCKKE